MRRRSSDALVGPPIPFGLAADHRGAHGLVQVRMDTFLELVRDVCVSLADDGFRRIVLLNGHYCNSHALQFAAVTDPRRAARGDADLSVPLLAGPAARGGRAVPLRQRRHPRERGGDLDRARDRPEPVRHGARPRLRPGAARAAYERARDDRSRSSSRPRARSGRSSRRAEASGARRASRPRRRARSSSAGARAPWSIFVRDLEDVHDRIEPGYLRTRPRR